MQSRSEKSQDSLRESIRESKEEMQNSLKEECRNIRVDNQKNIERLENNMMSLEERVERRFMSQTEQHSSELREMENRISQIQRKKPVN